MSGWIMRRAAIIASLLGALVVSAEAQAQPNAKPAKLSASSIRIEPVETDDILIPAEFRYAIYEHVVERVRQAGTFQRVIRSGDHSGDSIPDLVTLHMKVAGFKEGNRTVRELTTVLGSTTIDIDTTVVGHDGRTMLEKSITGKVRFRGDNIGATNDLAKHITKLLRESF
jgi:hypothetical protein